MANEGLGQFSRILDAAIPTANFEDTQGDIPDLRSGRALSVYIDYTKDGETSVDIRLLVDSGNGMNEVFEKRLNLTASGKHHIGLFPLFQHNRAARVEVKRNGSGAMLGTVTVDARVETASVPFVG